MQLFSPTSPTPTSSINTTGIPSSNSGSSATQPLPSSARQTWLNNNILNNNNHHHHVESVGGKNGARNAGHVTTDGKNGAKINNGYNNNNNTNQLTSSEGSKNGGKASSGSIFRAISVGRINNNAAKQHPDSKYYSSTKDGTLCISLLNK